MRIDFIAAGRTVNRFMESGSFIYRCHNLALSLAQAGHDISVGHLHRYDPGRRPHAVVLHRPSDSLRLRHLVSRLRRLGCVVLADFDDLVLSTAHARWTPFVLNGRSATTAVRFARAFRNCLAHQRALSLVDAIMVSTQPLAECVGKLRPTARTLLMGNSVHLSWRKKGTADAAAIKQSRTILYAPGSRTHDRDFAVVREPLRQLLAKHPQLRLHVVGPLEFELAARPGQILRTPLVPFAQYSAFVQSAWINIAPLEATPFNRCKSAVKAIEAGYFGIPTVCSRIPDMERFEGAGAVFADTAEDWVRVIEELLDVDAYASTTAGLRERTLALADIHARAGALVAEILLARGQAGGRVVAR